MHTWAGYAETGRAALLGGDYQTLGQLINANFDLRARLYQISSGNLEMVQTARSVGATSKFAGSGGAVVGTYQDETMYARLQAAMRAIGVEVIRPKLVYPRQDSPLTAGGDSQPL
jgi:glucuronokinase